jgi:NTP pyrophosphatase (non-canonical NTP hydrolase)
VSSFLPALREVNIIRDREWDTSDNGLDGSFFGNELAGEVGEAIEVGQAIYYGYEPEPSIEDLGEELADVIICVDLLALKFGIFVDAAISSFGEIEPDVELLNLAVFTGRACNITKKLERERLGLVGSRATLDDLAAELVKVLNSAFLLGIAYGIRLDVAVAAKFNKTSDKCGLVTKMQVPA